MLEKMKELIADQLSVRCRQHHRGFSFKDV